MNGYFKKNTPQLYGAISFLSAFLAISVECRGNIPKFIVLILPLVGVLVIYNLFLLLSAGDRIRQFFFSTKGVFSLLCFIFSLVLTCTPAIDLSNLRNHPFKNYHWLSVSLFGVLFSLSFLNYAILRPEGLWGKIVYLCKKVWGLPAKYFLLLSFLWIFILTNLFSFKVFGHIPHVQDSIAQLFQAKIFAQRCLTAPLPPIIEFFHYFYDNMVFTDRWYSQYPPGHPFFLMIGVIFGIPWIINPLFASFSVILLYQWVNHSYGEKEARLSVILFCVSPFVLFMSSTFMNHVSTLFFLLLFLYSLKKSQKEHSCLYALVSGFSLGTMVNIRTGDAFAIGVLFSGFFFIWSLLKKAYRPLLCFFLAAFMVLGILFLYNFATNGDPFLFGYQVRWGREHFIGFSHISIMDKPAHTPFRGILYTLRNFIALNQNLFEWPFPSLLPVAIWGMPFLFRKNWRDYFLLCGFFTAPLFYFFYFYQDICLGPRFYYVSLPFIFILTAKALFHIIEGIASLRQCSEVRVKNAFIALLFLSIIFSGVIRVPWLCRYYSDSFWEVDNKLMKKVQELGITNAVIFQKSYGFKGNDLGSGFLYNSPRLDSSIIFARDWGERNAELVHFFPGRTYYLALRNENGEVIINPVHLN